MSKNNTSPAGGLSLPAVLGIVFIVLKLCHVIDWSWWWVLAPFWITIAVVVLLVVILGIIAAVCDKDEIHDDYYD